MNKQTKIKQAIEDHINRTGDSQNELARKIGTDKVSAATISQIRNEKWGQISEKMWNMLANYFQIYLNEDEQWDEFETSNYKAITKLCQDAKSNRRMMAVAGFTGSGKTTALRSFARTYGDVYYVLCNKLMSRKDFVRAIQRAMGLEPEGSIMANVQAVVEKLRQAEYPLLILDDAGKLTDANLQLIQILYDETEFQAGIVLGGTDYLKTYIDKMAAKDKMGFRELKRRIQYWQPMQRPSKSIVSSIAKHNGIDAVDSINFLIRTAKDFGSLRALITNAKRAMALSDIKIITPDLLASLACGESQYIAA